MFTIEALLGVVIYVLVAGAVCWLLWWLIGFLGVPEPFSKIARGIVAVVGVLVLISLLFALVGYPVPLFKVR